MKIIKSISDIRTYVNDNQQEICYHGTKCDLIEENNEKYIQKTFICDDYFFTADYRFNAELLLNQRLAELKIPVPKVIEWDKKRRSIIYKYYQKIKNYLCCFKEWNKNIFYSSSP